MSIHKIQEADALLLYKVGPVYVCSPTMQVEAVQQPPKFTAPPGSNSSEPGMFKSLHGMVRVIDLRVRFGVEEEDRKTPGRIIIVEIEGGHAGFWVDEIEDVISFPKSGWAGVPSHIPRQVFSRTLTRNDQIRLYADFEQLDKFKSHGYLRKHIEHIKKAQSNKTEEGGAHSATLATTSHMPDEAVKHNSSAAIDAVKQKDKITDAPVERTASLDFKSKTEPVVVENPVVKEKLVNTYAKLPGTEKNTSSIKSTSINSPVRTNSGVDVKDTAQSVFTNREPSGQQSVSIKQHRQTATPVTAEKQEIDASEHYISRQSSELPATKDSTVSGSKKSSVIQVGNHSAGNRSVSATTDESPPVKVSTTQPVKNNAEENSSPGLIWLVIGLILLAGAALTGYELLVTGSAVVESHDKPAPMKIRQSEIDANEKVDAYVEVDEISEADDVNETVSPGLGMDVQRREYENSDLQVSGNVEIKNVEEDILIVVHEYEEAPAGNQFYEEPVTVMTGQVGYDSVIVLDVGGDVDKTGSVPDAALPDVNQAYEADVLPGASVSNIKLETDEAMPIETDVKGVVNDDAHMQQSAVEESEELEKQLPGVSTKASVQPGNEELAEVIEEADEKNMKQEQVVERSQLLERPVSKVDETKKADVKKVVKPVATMHEKSPASLTEGSQKTRRHIHVVAKGDTLWHIAKRYVNNPWRYPELARLSKIRNPDLIYPGQKIIIILNYK